MIRYICFYYPELSSALVSHICEVLFKATSGLIWAGSLEKFNSKATALMEEWETLERSEKTGPPAIPQYFRTHKLDEMRTKVAAFILKDLGLETCHLSRTHPNQ